MMTPTCLNQNNQVESAQWAWSQPDGVGPAGVESARCSWPGGRGVGPVGVESVGVSRMSLSHFFQ